MIKLQEFLFLFVTEVRDGGVRGNFYFSTDNDTWPKELRHNAITISELYVAIRKFDDNILDMTIKEIKERFSVPLAEGAILTFDQENGYSVYHPFPTGRTGALVVGDIFLNTNPTKYKIVLHKHGDELLPYEVTVEAKLQEDAIIKAKKMIAEIGWWGSKPLTIEYKMSKLVVKSIELI